MMELSLRGKQKLLIVVYAKLSSIKHVLETQTARYIVNCSRSYIHNIFVPHIWVFFLIKTLWLPNELSTNYWRVAPMVVPEAPTISRNTTDDFGWANNVASTRDFLQHSKDCIILQNTGFVIFFLYFIKSCKGSWSLAAFGMTLLWKLIIHLFKSDIVSGGLKSVTKSFVYLQWIVYSRRLLYGCFV